jgi:hypothetical protein
LFSYQPCFASFPICTPLLSVGRRALQEGATKSYSSGTIKVYTGLRPGAWCQNFHSIRDKRLQRHKVFLGQHVHPVKTTQTRASGQKQRKHVLLPETKARASAKTNDVTPTTRAFTRP